MVVRFFVGLAAGAALGAAGAVVYAARSGRDLRELLGEVRDEVASRDADALGMRLAAGASRLETGLARLNERLDAAIAETRGELAAKTGVPAEAEGEGGQAAALPEAAPAD
jgi:gas vesicle protein